MANIKFQEVTVVVNGSSRYNGNQYDSVMVQTTIITDSPLTESYYVPACVSLPNPALELIKIQGLEYRPYRASVLTEGTENIIQSSLAGDTTDTLSDSGKTYSLISVKRTPTGTSSTSGKQLRLRIKV